MNDLIDDLRDDFRRARGYTERALSELDDEAFFHRPGEQVNSVALIVKHLAGNMASRWTDFLSSDGDKPTRNRDGEFIITDADTRENLMAAWERGWEALFDTLDAMTDAELSRTITIRGEPHSARQALLRGLAHVSYHTGQILYLRRLLRPESTWLTVAPGQSKNIVADYHQRAEAGSAPRAGGPKA
jgi:uncharacterized damage-inducible protein DinB